MPPAARGHQTLSTYISARFDEFSRSQKDVAQYVVDHLDEVAFHTAEELARRASTSSSTVVRFSQALGFEGFPELLRGVERDLVQVVDDVLRDVLLGARELVEAGGDVGRKGLVTLGGGGHGRGPRPVSYTHLTLPTILLV